MAIDMNTITDAQLIAEFKQRFALPNFFRKKDVEEKHGIITNTQWESFKEDYNDSSMVWREASENFANDVEFMFDSNQDYENTSDEESDEDNEDSPQYNSHEAFDEWFNDNIQKLEDDFNEWDWAKEKWCEENNHEIKVDGVYNRDIPRDEKYPSCKGGGQVGRWAGGSVGRWVGM